MKSDSFITQLSKRNSVTWFERRPTGRTRQMQWQNDRFGYRCRWGSTVLTHTVQRWCPRCGVFLLHVDLSRQNVDWCYVQRLADSEYFSNTGPTRTWETRTSYRRPARNTLNRSNRRYCQRLAASLGLLKGLWLCSVALSSYTYALRLGFWQMWPLTYCLERLLSTYAYATSCLQRVKSFLGISSQWRLFRGGQEPIQKAPMIQSE